jgi:hypothetical protein
MRTVKLPECNYSIKLTHANLRSIHAFVKEFNLIFGILFTRNESPEKLGAEGLFGYRFPGFSWKDIKYQITSSLRSLPILLITISSDRGSRIYGKAWNVGDLVHSEKLLRYSVRLDQWVAMTGALLFGTFSALSLGVSIYQACGVDQRQVTLTIQALQTAVANSP